MAASVGHHHFNSADAESIAHIRRTIAYSELQDSATERDAYSTSSGAQPWVEVTEQPKTTAMRFRYQCEGRSAGTILGVNATVAQKTYPSIKVSELCRVYTRIQM